MINRQRLRDLARALWRAHVRFWAKKLKIRSTDKVFIVAPHADDETLGAGGLIAYCTHNRIPIKVVCINDGRFSHSEELIDNQELVTLREKEFESSLQMLGVNSDDIDFYGLAQEKMFEDVNWKTKTLEKINKFEPTIVVLPDYMDSHEDHSFISNQISSASVPAKILYAPIWHIVYGPKLRPKPFFKALARRAQYLDISQFLELKRKAWLNYETQATPFRNIEGWNYLDDGFSRHHLNKKEIFFTS